MTLVVDASAVAEILFGTEAGRRAAALLDGHELLAPQHLTAEVASVIRGWSLSKQITDEQALRAFREFDALDVEQVPMMSMLPAVYALRHNVSAYDAMHVVLARAAQCSLLTLDARLAASAPDCALLP
ncbi:type II toxin-antitoxin system VapC family toxin [Microbacterium sp. KUDC0406]|uniref:type II toxin-antitoxin system VapC family toxin n=1 Tax=Microbacterium sp. KUDC0406 TaxID=2909588 RepID=UPI001F2126B2|nr:type II toxin-antitoxin system VapC family toxin [Microbacterium sp. KUDC0406]UJP09893.1 type II toxin-antitoxin system VapC family toxin [Microbacterium sp. KUDC0406]